MCGLSVDGAAATATATRREEREDPSHSGVMRMTYSSPPGIRLAFQIDVDPEKRGVELKKSLKATGLLFNLQTDSILCLGG